MLHTLSILQHVSAHHTSSFTYCTTGQSKALWKRQQRLPDDGHV